MPLRRGVGIAVIAVAAGLCAPATAGAAADWESLAGRASRPWPFLQRGDGQFPDYVTKLAPGGHRDRYGTPMLGFALVQRGVHARDPRMAKAGLQAIDHAITHPSRAATQIFENLALSSAYNVVRGPLRTSPTFQRMRGRWERRLRRIADHRLSRTQHYSNWDLVESVTILELSRSGLQSSVPGSVLASRSRYRELARYVIDRKIPAAIRDYQREDARVGTLTMVSDPPHNPLSYQALSLGLLSRAVAILGVDEAANARRLLEEGVRASWALAAPDGDVSYFGRSQAQAWTLTMTAYGAVTVATLPGTSDIDAARYRALAERVLDRFGRLHVGGRYGMWITPSLRRGLRASLPGLDRYAAAVPYTGLALAALNWTIGRQGRLRVPAGKLAADEVGHYGLSRGKSTFAVVRRPNVWYAVKAGPGVMSGGKGLLFARDIRYDAGVHALKTIRSDGSWDDVMRLRPKTQVRVDSAGPWLIRGGSRGRPFGGRMDIDPNANLTFAGSGFRANTGRWVRRGVVIRHEPVGCGVRMVVPRRPGDGFEYSVFFRRRPNVAPLRVVDREQDVRFSQAARVSFEGGYTSGIDPRLLRVRLRFAPAAAGELAITICRTPGGG